MAVDYFLKLDGIEGESTDAQHKGELDVESFSWGETQSGSFGAGGGGGAGKVSMQDVHVVTRMSKASPKLFLACASGQHLKSAVLTGRRGGKEQAEFLKWTLNDVVVTSYQTAGGTDDGVVPMDSVSLGFSRLEVEYQQRRADGSAAGPVKAGWDLKGNQKL